MAICGFLPIVQFTDNNGQPLNGGKIATKITGTSTNKASYKAQDGVTAHDNPIILDAYGRPPSGGIWLSTDAEYRIIISDSLDNVLATYDNVSGILDPLSTAFTFNNIKFATGKGILDDSGNEQLIFTKTASAVNYVNATNAATGAGPTIAAAGDDTNIDLNLSGKGTGAVNINGTTFSSTSFRGKKDGHLLTYNSGTALDITAGVTCDTTFARLMRTTSTFTKNLNATWVAGTGNGGLASGVSYTTSTWYHVFVIQNSAGTVDFGFDTSVTAANLLAGSTYTYYRYIGSVKTDGSSNILPFDMFGDTIRLRTLISEIAAANPGTSAVTATLGGVPTGVTVMANLQVGMQDATATTTATYILITPLSGTDTTPAVTAMTVANGGIVGVSATAAPCSVMTNTSAQVRYRISTSDADKTVYIQTLGWRTFF